MGLINLVSVYNLKISDVAAGNILHNGKRISTNMTLSPIDVKSIGGR